MLYRIWVVLYVVIIWPSTFVFYLNVSTYVSNAVRENILCHDKINWKSIFDVLKFYHLTMPYLLLTFLLSFI